MDTTRQALVDNPGLHPTGDEVNPNPPQHDGSRTWVPQNIPDDADYRTVLASVRQCAECWVPGVRLIGNVRAMDIVRAVDEAERALTSMDAAPQGVENRVGDTIATTDMLFEIERLLSSLKHPNEVGYFKPRGGQEEQMTDLHSRIKMHLMTAPMYPGGPQPSFQSTPAEPDTDMVERVMGAVENVLDDHGLGVEGNANVVLHADLRARLTPLFRTTPAVALRSGGTEAIKDVAREMRLEMIDKNWHLGVDRKKWQNWNEVLQHTCDAIQPKTP